MPSFRKHLLTWLFFFAAACIGALDFSRGRGETALMMLLSGIVYIAGAWAAIGGGHRLLRGAAVVVVPLIAAFPFYLHAPYSDEGGMILAVTSIASLASFVYAGATALIIRPFNSPKTSRGARWQFSLSEILGWTIVVAIASAAVSKAILPGDDLQWPLLFIAVMGPLPSAAMIALFLAARPPRDRAAVIATAALLGAWNLVASFTLGVSFFEVDFFSGSALHTTLFVGLWILCVRLDREAFAAKGMAESVPPLKLHDESSHDE